MRIGKTARRVEIGDRVVGLRRTPEGVMVIRGEDDQDLARGLGFAHAHDRLVQMELLRLIGQGRLSECLKATDETLAVDCFMRRMGMHHYALQEEAECSDLGRAFGEAYCEGVNTYLTRHRRPLELLIAGHRPQAWGIADILTTAKVMSYVGLAQTQQDMEKLLIQALAKGVAPERLKRLFSPHLDGLTAELVALIGQTHVAEPLVPDALRFLRALPSLKSSNNWVVAPERSASGHALQCNDPHLECNRLPAIWYELVGELPDDYRIGISMPGVPGLIMGRTKHISAGFTYGFMDMVDYFIEEVRDDQVRRDGEQGSEFQELICREEIIQRKGQSPVQLLIRETSHGVLEADDQARSLPDGYYLCRAWSGHRSGAASAATLDVLASLPTARSVEAAGQIARRLPLSCNWLLADREGHIGFQQAGLLPERSHSGLYPLPGWDPANRWRGMVDPSKLASITDPPEGFLATANNDVSQPGAAAAINLCMGDARHQRISELLARSDEHDVEGMKTIQSDLQSTHADRYLAWLEAYLPATPVGELLRSWDRRYDAASKGATLFEAVYAALFRQAFGEGLFGEELWDHLVAETGIVTDFYSVFDQALLTEPAVWLGGDGLDGTLTTLVEQSLAAFSVEQVPSWGEQRKVSMENIFFAGKLPAFLGFDHGPVVVQGCRSTIVQGAVYRSGGRQTSFHPSWRFVTDMGTDAVHTALAGGPSGRRTSPWYKTDIERWLAKGYKTLTPDSDEP